MERHSFAMEIKEGKKNEYRQKLGEIWPRGERKFFSVTVF